MGSSPKGPTGLPASAGVLARYARAYAKQNDLAESRVRAWVAYMVLAGVLERFAAEDDGCTFTVKGGVALELRLGKEARATKDIDLVLHDAASDLVGALEQAVALTGPGSGSRDIPGYQGFQFRRRRPPIRLDNGAVNVELRVSYRGGDWTTISVDIARAEPGESETEMLAAVKFDDALGIAGPTHVPCLPLRFHIAQKLHGMTLPPRANKKNERFKDLVDLMLMEAMVSDYAGLRDACEQVFRHRGTHDWPPILALPPHWADSYAALAKDIGLPVQDAEEAMERVRAFVARIASAS